MNSEDTSYDTKILPFSKPKYRGLLTFLVLMHLKTNPGQRLKPFPSLLHIIQHYLTSCASFTSRHQHSNVLYSSDRCRNVFKNLPLVAYRRCKNISDILVRAELTEDPDSSNSRVTLGSFRCNSRNCTTCPYIEHGRTQYTFHSTGETYHIKSHITWTTFNVIYLIQCRLCNLQYIGETKRRLKDRFNEHRRPVLNPTSNYIHTAVSEHFLSNNHSGFSAITIPFSACQYQRCR